MYSSFQAALPQPAATKVGCHADEPSTPEICDRPRSGGYRLSRRPAGVAYLHCSSQRRRRIEKFMCLLPDREA
jgi:hypothetical protein